MYTTYTEARKNLKKYCDVAEKDSEPVIISRRNGENVVLLSEQEYRSMHELAYLLRSPANAVRLLEALEESRSDKVNKEFDLEKLSRELSVDSQSL